MDVARRRSSKRAKVALARKIAVILHRMWIDGTTYRWAEAKPIAARQRKLLFLAVGEYISPRLALQKLAELGAKDGMLLDGGDSSSMVLGKDAAGVPAGVLYGGWRPVATYFGVRAKPLRAGE
jgi:Phosphodiester glycosidase